MLRILILVLFLRLFAATMSSEVTSYAKVSKNGQLAKSSHDSLSWITRTQEGNDTNVYDEGRSISDVVLTISPIYVTPRISKLKKGEAIDHPKYSTLDYEMIGQLDTGRKQQIQQRFRPPAIFEHDVAYTNKKPQKGASTSNVDSSSDINSSTFLGPIYPNMYEYSPAEYVNDKPTSKPTSNIQKYPPLQMDDEMSNSYESPPSNYHASNQQEMDYSNFDVSSSYDNDESMKKPMKFSNNRPFPLAEHDPYEHDQHDFHHHEVIYDHLPEYHIEHTTEEPEMNDQRLDKRPYSYYFIGKKLWYIPLYFSIYFIIYIAALVLKSIARHKINFPTHLAEVANHVKRSDPSEGWWNFVERAFEELERFAETSGKGA